MKVILLGCGEMGESALHDLYQYGKFDEILIATRTIEKANKIVAELEGQDTIVKTVSLDVRDTNKLVSLLKTADVVVNAVGPNYKYELIIAKATIEAKVDLVDINDDYETTLEMYELDSAAREAGITIVLGLGASPGVNNVLVRAAANQLDTVEKIHTAWVMSGSDPGGLALSYHLIKSLSDKAFTVENGKIIEVQSFVDGKEKMNFPDPVGDIDVFHIGHPEPITLARVFPEAVSINDKASFNPPWVNDLIVQLGKLVREYPGPIKVNGHEIEVEDFAAAYFHQRCKSLKNIPQEGGLRVEVEGLKNNKRRRVFFSSAGRISLGTGIPASIGAIMLVNGEVKEKGVLPPEACIDATEFLYELIDRRNVAKLNGWVEDLTS